MANFTHRNSFARCIQNEDVLPLDLPSCCLFKHAERFRQRYCISEDLGQLTQTRSKNKLSSVLGLVWERIYLLEHLIDFESSNIV